MYDTVTGQQVNRLRYHQTLVRDCSWHPFDSELTSVSWDGSVVRWGQPLDNDGDKRGAGRRALPQPDTDQLGY